MIEVGGLANVQHDYAIPFKYGVDQCIADTIGPGGIFKYLRTAPFWLAILDRNLNPVHAYVTRKIKATGKMEDLLKLQKLL